MTSTLMNRDDFRAALENAIKGKSANKAPFSVAWATGRLSREHLARWAENHYHYVGPFADYLGYLYARTPAHMVEAKDFLLANMYEEEIGGDRHTDLLIRFAEVLGRPDLAADPAHAAVLKDMEAKLRTILDPEAVDAEAKAAQAIW